MIQGSAPATDHSPLAASHTVLVLGGGLAGLAASQRLAEHGWRVTLLEARGRLGGRAGSFVDAVTGQLVDACQHVSMGCCTELRRFFETVGVGHLLKRQPVLHFMTPDRRVSRFKASLLPAPLHLIRTFLGCHFLTLGEKLRIAGGLARLMWASGEADPPFLDWLLAHRQTPRTVDRFWGLVLTSALNETPDRIGLRYARKVFRDAFLTDRHGFELEVPAVPLGRLYGEELLGWLERHGVQVRLNEGVKRLVVSAGRVDAVELRSGERLSADAYLCAVPHARLLDLLPAEVVESHDSFKNLRNLKTAPITSVHLWYDRPVLELPNVVLVDCLGQWVFNRGEVAKGEQYLQVVVSAARQFRGLGHDEVQRRIVAELEQLFPAARRLLRARVVTEHAATFSPVPGVDRWRPGPATPIENLFLAGDWTATGWPATMEGAVRSGFRAAEAVRAASFEVIMAEKDQNTAPPGG